MKWPISTVCLTLVAALLSPPRARAADVWTSDVDNTRQGWNQSETILTSANVPRLRKIREFAVDEKVDVSPLVVGNRLYVFTMANTAYIFDVDTGVQIAKRQLAPPFDQMDMWRIYHSWGITTTPRCRNQHALCRHVRATRWKQPEYRTQQSAVDTRCLQSD